MQLAKHIQDAFDNGGSVSINGQIVTTVEDFLKAQAEMNGESAPETTPQAEEPVATVEQKSEPDSAKVKKEKDAHEKTKLELEKTKGELETTTTAISAAKETLRAFIPATKEELEGLAPEKLDLVKTLYGLESEKTPELIDEIISTVHATE